MALETDLGEHLRAVSAGPSYTSSTQSLIALSVYMRTTPHETKLYHDRTPVTQVRV